MVFSHVGSALLSRRRGAEREKKGRKKGRKKGKSALDGRHQTTGVYPNISYISAPTCRGLGSKMEREFRGKRKEKRGKVRPRVCASCRLSSLRFAGPGKRIDEKKREGRGRERRRAWKNVAPDSDVMRL